MAYIPPEPSDLKAKYPAFAAVADYTIDLRLLAASLLILAQNYPFAFQTGAAPKPP